jgi:uncharacterized delta-60 repeat protein
MISRVMTSARWTLAAVAALLAISPAAAASPGARLDPGFGRGGIATAFDAIDYGQTQELALAPNGGIYVAGASTRDGRTQYRARLLHLTPGGRLDPNFGDNGVVELSSGKERYFALSGLAVDGFGRLLVFGDTANPELAPSETTNLARIDATVRRYKPDGTRDSSFSKDGAALLDFGLPPEPKFPQPQVRVEAGAVDRLDRPVLLAYHFGGRGEERFVARLTAAGEPDGTFGGGNAIAPLPSGFHGEISLDEQGEVTTADWDFLDPNLPSLRIERLNPSGAPDASFGVGGVGVYPPVTSMWQTVPAGVGRILAVGRGTVVRGRPKRPTHVRVPFTMIGADGQLDADFGEGGTAQVTMPGIGRLQGVVPDPRGGFLAAGWLKVRRHGERLEEVPQEVVLARLLPSGKLDRHFGKHGFVVTALGRGQSAVTRGLSIDSQGRLVVLALASGSEFLETSARAVLLRYRLAR